MNGLLHDLADPQRLGPDSNRTVPEFRRGVPEVHFDHPRDVGYQRLTYRRLPRKNLRQSWETLVDGRWAERDKHIVGSSDQAEAMGRCGQTMNLHRRALANLGTLGYIKGWWDHQDGSYSGKKSEMHLHSFDPDALVLPEGLDVWVTSRDTGVPPVDEASLSAPPGYVWESSWKTPRGLPTWIMLADDDSKGSRLNRPKMDDEGVVGRLAGEPLVVADPPPVLVLVKEGSRRTLSLGERSEPTPSLRLPMAPAPFGLPEVIEALREEGMGHSYAAAKRWVSQHPAVERVERVVYVRLPDAP